jgi:hypothetical protein
MGELHSEEEKEPFLAQPWLYLSDSPYSVYPEDKKKRRGETSLEKDDMIWSLYDFLMH